MRAQVLDEEKVSEISIFDGNACAYYASSFIDRLWGQFATPIPSTKDEHPLKHHQPRGADRVICGKLIQVPVFIVIFVKFADTRC